MNIDPQFAELGKELAEIGIKIQLVLFLVNFKH